MAKKTIVLSIVIVLIVIISAGLGYTAAYAQGLCKVVDMDIRANCNNLLIGSLILARSSDMEDFIDNVEHSYTCQASFIRAYEEVLPFSSSETKKVSTEALEAWENAKIRIEDIRAMYLKQKQQ